MHELLLRMVQMTVDISKKVKKSGFNGPSEDELACPQSVSAADGKAGPRALPTAGF
jgi:hypothetical protein